MYLQALQVQYVCKENIKVSPACESYSKFKKTCYKENSPKCDFFLGNLKKIVAQLGYFLW